MYYAIGLLAGAFLAAIFMVGLSSTVAMREKRRADRLDLAVRALTDIIHVDQDGNTIAKGVPQWRPALMLASVATGDESLREPLVFHTAGVDLEIPVYVPGATTP